MQELPAPFQVSGRKHAEHKLFYHLPKIQKSPALFSTLFHMYLCIKGTEEFFANTYPPPMSREGDTQPDMQAFLRLLAAWKYSCNHRAIPLLPVPPSISLRDRPIMGGGCGRAAPTQQGEAWAGFARMRFFPQTLAEHVQAERFEMFIKWLSLAGKQSESHSPAKSQQHRGTRASQIGGYLTVSRQAKLFFPFPKKLVVPVPHQSHAIHAYMHKHTCTHTQSSTSTIYTLLSEEMGLSWFTANVREVLYFRSTHHNNRKPHDGWNSFL